MSFDTRSNVWDHSSIVSFANNTSRPQLDGTYKTGQNEDIRMHPTVIQRYIEIIEKSMFFIVKYKLDSLCNLSVA